MLHRNAVFRGGEGLPLSGSRAVSRYPFCGRLRPRNAPMWSAGFAVRTLAAAGAARGRASVCPARAHFARPGARQRLAHRPARTPPRRPVSPRALSSSGGFAAVRV
jgi:hypothetical protein